MVVPWGSWHLDHCSDLPGLPKTFPVFFTGGSEMPWDQMLGPCLKNLFGASQLPGVRSDSPTWKYKVQIIFFPCFTTQSNFSIFFCNGQRAGIISARGTLPSRTKESQMPPKDHFSPVRSSITCNTFWWCTAVPWVLFKELTRVGEHYVDLFALSWVIANQEALLGIAGLYFTVMERWYHYTNPFSSDGMIAVTREPCDPYPQHKMPLYRPREPRN